MFRNRAASDMVVDFSTGHMTGELLAFKPGERIAGQVTITPENDISLKEILISLGWHTEGRGDRDSGTMEEVTHMGGSLNARSPRTHEFTFTAPPAPWSYAGTLINIIWAVEVTLVQERGRPYTMSQPIIISPTLTRLNAPKGAY